ncbi:MAG TPA: ABC transporter permease [Micromonosporaceae bacterium]|nr:ABC transporter permease [Micromonosporaceae bacterium]
MTQMDLMTAPAAPPEGGDLMVLQSGWRLAVREFLANRLAVVGFGVLVFFVLFSFFGPLVYHTDQTNTNILFTDQPPGAGHPLGTDDLGFDVLGRLMKGGQASLEIGFLAAAIATVIGTLWGAIAGLVGGILDAFMMRIVDVLLSIPFLFIVLIVSIKYGASVLTLSAILGVFSWLTSARLVRGEVLTLRVRDFVAAAKVMGATQLRLIYRHLIPNALGVVIVNITFEIANAILAVAALGFLGFGIQFPQTDWGTQVSNSVTEVLNGYWWLVYPVSICLVATVMACNLVGDALRDAFDVRLRRR